MGRQDTGASVGASGFPAHQARCRCAGCVAVALAAWGPGCTPLLAPLCPPIACAHPSLPAPSHRLCVPTHFLRPPLPACACTAPTRARLHPDAACALALPTPAHALPAPTVLPCLLLPTGLSPPSPGPLGQGIGMGVQHQPGMSPSLCPPVGLGECGAGFLTAHSSPLPAPAAGAKPDWILNWKINLDSCESQPLPSLCARDPAARTPCLPRLPAPSHRWGN